MANNVDHLAIIEGELRPGEAILASVSAVDTVTATSFANTIVGHLAVTETRLIFSGSARRTAALRSHALALLPAFDVRWMKNSVEFRLEGSKGYNGYFSKDIARSEPFVTAVQTALDNLKRGPAPRAKDNPNGEGVPALIELANLYERGLLTADEYATAKERLLS